MENSRVPVSRPREGTSHEKPYEALGQWTRLDSNQRPSRDDSGLGQPQNAPQTTGATGIVPQESVALPQLTLEDRLAVAISARGHQRIGQFLENVLSLAEVREDETHRCIFYLSDEDLVLAFETAVGS